MLVLKNEGFFFIYQVLYNIFIAWFYVWRNFKVILLKLHQRVKVYATVVPQSPRSWYFSNVTWFPFLGFLKNFHHPSRRQSHIHSREKPFWVEGEPKKGSPVTVAFDPKLGQLWGFNLHPSWCHLFCEVHQSFLKPSSSTLWCCHPRASQLGQCSQPLWSMKTQF